MGLMSSLKIGFSSLELKSLIEETAVDLFDQIQ